jgi:phosphoserine phosphatase
MRFIATLIGPEPGSLSSRQVEAARQALAGLGAATDAPDWLAPGQAADLAFDDLDPDQADAAIRQAIEGPIDCVAQPRDLRRKRLLVADMESTIIQQEMLDELATLRGIGPQIAAITARAMNGEIDFVGALKERVGLLGGMSEQALETVAGTITFMPGARALVATMRRTGARAILVSGGFTRFADPVASVLGFDAVYANRLEIAGEDGARVLTGQVGEPVLDRDDKLRRLVQEAGRSRIPLSETLAVGDGANDVPMLQAAGLGVAYHAKPSVRASARTRIDHADLTALLYAQGFRAAEIREA